MACWRKTEVDSFCLGVEPDKDLCAVHCLDRRWGRGAGVTSGCDLRSWIHV